MYNWSDDPWKEIFVVVFFFSLWKRTISKFHCFLLSLIHEVFWHISVEIVQLKFWKCVLGAEFELEFFHLLVGLMCFILVGIFKFVAFAQMKYNGISVLLNDFCLFLSHSLGRIFDGLAIFFCFVYECLPAWPSFFRGSNMKFFRKYWIKHCFSSCASWNLPQYVYLFCQRMSEIIKCYVD